MQLNDYNYSQVLFTLNSDAEPELTVQAKGLIVVGRFSYDIETNCAFFEKSTKFGTEVAQPIVTKFGYCAIA